MADTLTSSRLLAGPETGYLATHVFPTLTAAQLERIAVFGRRRAVAAGEILQQTGEPPRGIFVVTRGELAAEGTRLQRQFAFTPGMFTGEAAILTGRPGLALIRATADGEVIEVERDALLELIRVDGDLGAVLMREFLLRRTGLIDLGLSDAVLVGSNHSRDSQRLREFLTRNRHPFTWLDLDRDAEVQTLLERFQVSVADVPVLICRDTLVLKNPSNREVADCLGFNEAVDRTHVRDLVVVGAGPAGLAAAVYAASEGLDVLVVEIAFPGGQAGSSSKIENYLGFPTGISGQELTERAYAQAQKFGAEVIVAESVRGLDCAIRPFGLITDSGRIQARSIVLATGARYRKLDLEDMGRFEGAGIYYAATPMEAQGATGEEVVVVGGGNSAGQAAVFLSETCRVHVLVRGDGLAETMSRYLIHRIEESPSIELHARTEVVGVGGGEHLESVTWRNRDTGRTETRAVRHLFVMAGAEPNTPWLCGCLALDEHGFIKTGAGLSPEELANAGWALARSPYLLETSRPGVFAVGDVRSSSIKRVASAVGEGSSAVALVHQALRE